MIIGRLKKGNPMRKENRFRIFDLFAPGRTQDPADSPQPENLLDSPRFSGFSETAPDFSIGAGYELVSCPGGELAVYPKHMGFDTPVHFFDPKGKKRRSVTPAFNTFLAVRDGLIYSCGSEKGWTIMDLDGKCLPLPWEDYPEAQRIYDMDAGGRRILYYEMKYGTGFFLKDMDTGVEIHNFPLPSEYAKHAPLVQCALSSAFFLHDGSIVLGRDKHFLERFDPETGRLLQDAVKIEYDYVSLDFEKRRIICRKGKKRAAWAVFDDRLRLVCEWGSEAAPESPAYVPVPGTSRLAYETETHVCVYDYLENRRICAVPLPHSEKFSRRELRVAPDGKTLYVKGEEGWHVMKM